MNVSPGVLVWRIRCGPPFVSCVIERVEDCFELRIFDGDELIHTESFDKTEPLLARAEKLRKRLDPAREVRPVIEKRELVRS